MDDQRKAKLLCSLRYTSNRDTKVTRAALNLELPASLLSHCHKIPSRYFEEMLKLDCSTP